MIKKILIGIVCFIAFCMVSLFVLYKVLEYADKQEYKEHLFEERYEHCRMQGHNDIRCLEFAQQMQEVDEQNSQIRVIGANN